MAWQPEAVVQVIKTLKVQAVVVVVVRRPPQLI
jgi:hypothetical protein